MKSIFLAVVGLGLSLNVSATSIDNEKALALALDDEYKAKATYLKVLEDFGQVKPFSNIVQAEERHIQALIPFFQKYNIPVPANKYLGAVASYKTLKEACEAGVLAEEENVKLYDQIFAMTDDKDLVVVFENLRRASLERHLPAFKRCISR